MELKDSQTPPIAFDQAIEVFVRAFCFTKSFAHPYLPERVGKLWKMSDGPGRKEPRKTEWVAKTEDPEGVISTIRANDSGRHAVCVIRTIDQSDSHIRESYKNLGYRLMATEGFFIHPLDGFQESSCSAGIQRVMDTGLADQLAVAARTRQMLPEHIGIDDSPLRQYVAVFGDDLAGWVRSITVAGCTWCSNLYVPPRFRRQGIGAALMTAMLKDDKAYGSQASVLLASHAGAMLYPQLGYEQIGELLLYVPQKRRSRV